MTYAGVRHVTESQETVSCVARQYVSACRTKCSLVFARLLSRPVAIHFTVAAAVAKPLLNNSPQFDLGLFTTAITSSSSPAAEELLAVIMSVYTTRESARLGTAGTCRRSVCFLPSCLVNTTSHLPFVYCLFSSSCTSIDVSLLYYVSLCY